MGFYFLLEAVIDMKPEYGLLTFPALAILIFMSIYSDSVNKCILLGYRFLNAKIGMKN